MESLVQTYTDMVTLFLTNGAKIIQGGKDTLSTNSARIIGHLYIKGEKILPVYLKLYSKVDSI